MIQCANIARRTGSEAGSTERQSFLVFNTYLLTVDDGQNPKPHESNEPKMKNNTPNVSQHPNLQHVTVQYLYL